MSGQVTNVSSYLEAVVNSNITLPNIMIASQVQFYGELNDPGSVFCKVVHLGSPAVSVLRASRNQSRKSVLRFSLLLTHFGFQIDIFASMDAFSLRLHFTRCFR